MDRASLFFWRMTGKPETDPLPAACLDLTLAKKSVITRISLQIASGLVRSENHAKSDLRPIRGRTVFVWQRKALGASLAREIRRQEACRRPKVRCREKAWRSGSKAGAAEGKALCRRRERRASHQRAVHVLQDGGQSPPRNPARPVRQNVYAVADLRIRPGRRGILR